MSWNNCEYYGCESYTARPDGKHCETHRRQVLKEDEQMKKQEVKFILAKSKPKKLYKAPNKVSEKRKVENKLYSELKEEFLKVNTRCQIKFVGCEFSSVDVHHKVSGSNKAANLNNTDTWLAACRHCHTFLHDKISAKEAREKGLKI